MILSFANFRTIGRSTVKVKWCGCDLLLRKDVSRLPNIWSKQWHGGKLDATTASFNFLHNFASLWEIGVGSNWSMTVWLVPGRRNSSSNWIESHANSWAWACDSSWRIWVHVRPSWWSWWAFGLYWVRRCLAYHWNGEYEDPRSRLMNAVQQNCNETYLHPIALSTPVFITCSFGSWIKRWVWKAS